MFFFLLREHNKQKFIFAVGACCFGVHCILLYGLFVCYRADNEHIMMTLRARTGMNQEFSVVLLSLPQGEKEERKKIKDIANEGMAQTSAQGIKICSSPDKKRSTVVAKKEQKKEVQKNKAVQKSTVKRSNIPTKKKVTEKKVAVQEKKQPILKRIVDKKNSAESKKDEKKTEVLASVVKKDDKASQIPQELVVRHHTKEGTVGYTAETVPLSARERELLQKQEYVEQELARVWHPPQVQTPHAQCTFRLCVSRQGTIEKVELISSSGIVMYDIAARTALYQMVVPAWLKGKSMTVVLEA